MRGSGGGAETRTRLPNCRTFFLVSPWDNPVHNVSMEMKR
jgi:hypothetical protein